jgi:acetyltransferase-like isoleucine patch superfamily enzyme
MFFYKVYIKYLIYSANFSSICKLIIFKLLYNDRFNYTSNISIGCRFSLFLDNSKSVFNLGENIQFRNDITIRLLDNAFLKIGKSVFFNNSCSINCMSEISIGDNTQFGESVKIYDHNHQYRNLNLLINQQGYVKGKVIIGSNCWIGSNVVILKDVVIGDNVVVGAGCVIYKSIPSNSLVKNNQNLSITSIGL